MAVLQIGDTVLLPELEHHVEIDCSVEFDQDSIVSCVESEAADAPKENSKGEHIWRHGAGRQKKRLPKKGRKKSSVFVNQVKKRFLPWIMMT